MHARIAELGQQLQNILDNPPERPTADDRRTLMQIRDAIKNFDEEGLSDQDVTDRQGLYVLATREANRQEDFYENNDNKWADAA